MSEAANPLRTRFEPPVDARLEATLPAPSRQLPEQSKAASAMPIPLKPSTLETAPRPWITEVRRQVQMRWHVLHHRINSYRKEQPMTALFVLAGVAFTAGIMLRVWRSAND
jgi:hypothetical protein